MRQVACVPGGPDSPDQALSLGVSVLRRCRLQVCPVARDTQGGLQHRENLHHGMNFSGTKGVSSVDSVTLRRQRGEAKCTTASAEGAETPQTGLKTCHRL